MRNNIDGVFAFIAMVGMVFIGLLRGGYTILVVAVVIIVYGAAVLTFQDDRIAIDICHLAFLLTLGSFFVGLPYEPFITWAVALLAAYLSTAIIPLILEEDYSEPNNIKLHQQNTLAFFPFTLLVIIAIAKNWEPLWYFTAALLTYSALLWKKKPKPAFDLAPSYTALTLISLGVLVSVSGIPKPAAWDDT